jgi:tetratricopeptide (TPR) repeat protein
VRWARHSPLAATLAAGLVLALSIGLLATARLWRRAEAERVRADSERREAEADFELANEIFEGFAESILIRFYDAEPAASLESSLIPLLRRGRQQLLALAHRHPDHLAAHKRLAGTDNRLASILIQSGARDEARPLLAEAQESLDRVIAEGPMDPAVLRHQADTYVLDFQLAADEGRAEDAVEYQERALAAYERLLQLEPTRALVIELADRRSGLAVWLLARRGREARARSLIEANIRMLADDPRGASDPAMAIRRVFAHEDLRQLGTNGRSEPTASRAAPGTDALSRLISPEADDLGPEDWASVVIEILSMGPTTGGTSPILEPDSIGSFVSRAASRAAARRHAGRLDQARQIADRLHAFARRLVARYPDQAAAHWALSQAYVQIYKNAWQTADRAAIERYLKLAVNAATHALVLDPDSAVVCRHLADFQKRLDNLLSPPKPVDASDPAARSGRRN